MLLAGMDPEAVDRQLYLEREETKAAGLGPDPMAGYISTLSATNHPESECGDPYGCPGHARDYQTYHGCICVWPDGPATDPVRFASGCPNPAHGDVA